MVTKQFTLLSDPGGKCIFFGFMQTEENAFAVASDICLPFAGGLMRIDTNDPAFRVTLRSAAIHAILLVRDFTQIFNAVVCANTIDVINLMFARIFSGAKRPNQPMRQVSGIANTDADVSAALNDAAGNSAGLNPPPLRSFANQQPIAHFKQTPQFRQRWQRLNLGCHLRFSEVATGQAVGAALSHTVPHNFIGVCTMLINTVDDLQAAADSPERTAFLTSLLNDYTTFDDAEYPEGYDRTLLEGDEGYVAPVLRLEWNASAAAAWGFDSRKQIEAALKAQ